MDRKARSLVGRAQVNIRVQSALPLGLAATAILQFTSVFNTFGTPHLGSICPAFVIAFLYGRCTNRHQLTLVFIAGARVHSAVAHLPNKFHYEVLQPRLEDAAQGVSEGGW